MALIHCDFYSDMLGMSTSMDVILPQNTETQIGMESKSFCDKYPTLYLLHGYTDDHTIWQRRTSIERYVAELGLAVVMPNVNRSYYADLKTGERYWSFVSEELPKIVRSFFNLSDLREDNFVAGLSMGGFGAFKLALNHPEKFAAAASLSGVCDIDFHARTNYDRAWDNILGDFDKIKGSINDLFYLAKRVSESKGPKPKLYQCCGTEDELIEGNRRFSEFCKGLSLEHKYVEEPGDHEWGFWDKNIQKVLEWLPIKAHKKS